MDNISQMNRIDKFIHYMELGSIMNEPEKLTGGLMHTIYVVVTDKGKYAVKILNPAVMEREKALKNTIHSEIIAAQLSNRVPAVTALQKDGQTVILIEGSFLMVFPWQEGTCIFASDITAEHCGKIGSILGRIHAANVEVEGINPDAFCHISYDWEEYYKQGKEKQCIWTEELSQCYQNLYIWAEKVNTAAEKLSSLQIISHRDMDPKNVMWNQEEPFLIDWESAGYINPYQELIEVICYWCSNEDGSLDQERYKDLISAYKKEYPIPCRYYKEAVDSGYAGMLGWLDYSFKRSLGMESNSNEEQELGTKQVTATLRELRKYEHKAALLHTLLQ